MRWKVQGSRMSKKVLNLMEGGRKPVALETKSMKRLKTKKSLSCQIGTSTGRCSSANASNDIINITIYYHRVSCSWIKILILSILSGI